MAVRFEPYKIEIANLHPECQGILQREGWLEFFSKFQDHNVEVTRVFAQSFDGECAHVGNLTIHISENSKQN
jgi:hypothetical protein